MCLGQCPYYPTHPLSNEINLFSPGVNSVNEEYIGLDSSTGDIELIKSLDYEAHTSLTIVVIATDGAGQTVCHRLFYDFYVYQTISLTSILCRFTW